jgi:hypothetical protein
MVRYMAANITGRPKAHFLHVGKTGGTAIKNALRPHRSRGPYELFLHGHSVSLRDIPPGDKVFYLLRRPESRFVSSFYSRLREGRPRLVIPWRTLEAVAFKEFQTAPQLAKALRSPDPELAGRARLAMQNIFHLRDSFYRWFESEDYLASRRDDILFVGFQERLNQDFPKLLELLGLEGRASLPDDDVKAHRNPASAEKTLDDEAKANLAWWYYIDDAFYDRRLREAEDPVGARSTVAAAV